MGYILSFYTEDTYTEFFLPAINNSNYIISLDKKQFILDETAVLILEVVEGEWRVLSSDKFSLTQNGESFFGRNLKSGYILKLGIFKKEISVLVEEERSSLVPFSKYDISYIDKIYIGKDAGNTICFNANGVIISKRHSCICRRNGSFYVEDVSKNGTYLNNVRVRGEQELRLGDCVNIFGLKIIFWGKLLAVYASSGEVKVNASVLRLFSIPADKSIVPNKEGQKKHYYHRSPRNIIPLHMEPIEIEGPPSPQKVKKQPLLLTLGPSFTMVIPMLMGSLLSIYSRVSTGSNTGLYMYVGLVTAGSAALIGVMWAIIRLRASKKMERQEEMLRFELYSDYLLRVTDSIKDEYDYNRSVLHEMYPDAEKCCEYSEKSTALWGRNRNHEDFLGARLGIGDVPFQVPIVIPEKKFSLINDSLAEKPRLIYENYRMLKNVPLCIDLLQHSLVGLVGGDGKSGAIELVRLFAVQIAANVCYTDVKLVFIYNDLDDSAKEWNGFRWLPHVWTEDKGMRFIAANKNEASDVFYELTKVLRMRSENEDLGKKGKIPTPHYVLFISDLELLEGEVICKYIFEPKQEHGFSVVLMAENSEALPNECEFILKNDKDLKEIYNLKEGGERKEISFDRVDTLKTETFFRRISNVEVSTLQAGGDVPTTLDFFEMYGVTSLEDFNVLSRWRKNRTYENMRSLIGQKAGGANCYLDIHEKYHGPHGLIAGTTGSGKSETLQTYILSLAINFSPDDIGFFIIDFKGGGMANLFSSLPHVIGQISNLSGNQVHRAMVSIKSENMRRQRIFGEYGVNHIDAYTRLYKNKEALMPVPHVFIIIDEFAELKKEEPDFMRELISVAQVGRSLGVHLILATQKPSGTVDDNIWSNTKFRVCLRVQDKQDSNDMLHKPDAAYITNAGRGYLQVGNDEIFELFQSGWSGAVYEDDMADAKAEIAKMLDNTGRAALIGNRNKFKRKEKRNLNWLMALGDCVMRAADDMGWDMETYYLTEDLTVLIENVYENLYKAGLNYPVSSYNVSRLKKFIQMMAEERAGSLDKTINAVISKASRIGEKLPEVKEKTQLDAVIDYLRALANNNGYDHILQLWMPVLPEDLYLKDLGGYEQQCFNGEKWAEFEQGWTLKAYIGLCDDPVNQSQMPLIIDFAENGHYVCCGTVVSGKSTFLQSLIYSLTSRYAPSHLNIYALDFSSKMLSAFEDLAHVGGIMYENDLEKIGKFFKMADRILEQRKTLLKGGNYSQYVRVNGVTLPSILIVIDNFANFKEKTENIYEENLIKISRDGVGYGIFLIITSAGFGMAEIQSRIGNNIRNAVCLEMGDKFKYADILKTLRIDVLPESNVKGRGLAIVNGSILEFQTALALEADDDFQRIKYLQDSCKVMNNAWHGEWAQPIPEIPNPSFWSDLCKLADFEMLISDDRHLPIGYNIEDASVYSVDLKDTYCYTISGRARTGKTNMLRIMLLSAYKKGGRHIVVDMGSGDFKSQAENMNVEYIESKKELFDFLSSMIDIFKNRNLKKRELLQKGLDDEEVYTIMRQEERIFIYISDLRHFIEAAYTPDKQVGDMHGFLENIVEKGSLHNIFFIGALNTDEALMLTSRKLFSTFIGYRIGIHLGGNISGQKIFSYSNISYQEQARVLKPGTGIAPMPSDNSRAVMVAIPQARGKADAVNANV